MHISLVFELDKAVSSWLAISVVDNSHLSNNNPMITTTTTLSLTLLTGPKLSNSRRIFDSAESKFWKNVSSKTRKVNY